jgi:hypothetical protein
MDKWRWKFVCTVPCALPWVHRCQLHVLLIPLRVKVASSVDSFNGSNWRLVCNQWQNSRRMTLPPGCRFCTHYGWNGYNPSSCNVHQNRCRRVESLGVLVRVVWLRCTISRMFTCSSICWRARSDETWTLGRVSLSRNILSTPENTLRPGILLIGNRRRYYSTAAVALPSQKP